MIAKHALRICFQQIINLSTDVTEAFLFFTVLCLSDLLEDVYGIYLYMCSVS